MALASEAAVRRLLQAMTDEQFGLVVDALRTVADPDRVTTVDGELVIRGGPPLGKALWTLMGVIAGEAPSLTAGRTGHRQAGRGLPRDVELWREVWRHADNGTPPTLIADRLNLPRQRVTWMLGAGRPPA